MRRFRIGRSESSEIVIADASVSRQHAELVELGGGRFALSDLGSSFGTHVWQNDAWIPAANTEIGADTAIRFGDFRTTVFDLLGEADRAALGLTPPPAPAPPASPPAAEPAHEPPPAREAAPPQAPARAAVAPPATPAQRARSGGRARLSVPERRRLAMRLGLVGLASFFAFAIVAVVAVLTLGDANPPVRKDDPNAATAAENQRNFLAACTGQWNVEERRCRCFLATAGPYLQPDDYADFGDVVAAYLSGDSGRAEGVLQQITDKRGVHANTRLRNAFKGVVRDCQESSTADQPPQR
jgi:hypothetical protein